MTALAAVLDRVARLLEARGRRFALVGGLAVSARVEPRFTRDIDLAVAVATDAEAEALVKDLAVTGLKAIALVEHDVHKRLSTVRLASTGAERGIVTDLLFASSGIETEIVRDAEPLEVFAGVNVPVARIGHLLAMKLLARDARRPQDDVDLRGLLEVADELEIHRAEAAVDLITSRGFHRGRDLRRALSEALR